VGSGVMRWGDVEGEWGGDMGSVSGGDVREGG
jgi:hypothetical protein